MIALLNATGLDRVLHDIPNLAFQATSPADDLSHSRRIHTVLGGSGLNGHFGVAIATGEVGLKRVCDRMHIGRGKALECLRFEADCRELAKNACCPDLYSHYLRMADVWLTLAVLEGRLSLSRPSGAVFYIQKGKLKVTVVSDRGKDAVAAILGPDEFFGEACMTGQILRLVTASAMTEAVVERIEKPTMIRMVKEQPEFSEMFINHILNRTIHTSIGSKSRTKSTTLNSTNPFSG